MWSSKRNFFPKTEAEADGQCECQLEGEVGLGYRKPCCTETTCQIHRPHTEVGRDAVAEEEDIAQLNDFRVVERIHVFHAGKIYELQKCHVNKVQLTFD